MKPVRTRPVPTALAVRPPGAFLPPRSPFAVAQRPEPSGSVQQNAHEQHADAVANLVVQGRSAVPLLARTPGGRSGEAVGISRMSPLAGAIQKKDEKFKGSAKLAAPGDLVNFDYPGHQHSALAGRAETDCCQDGNTIETAGEELDEKRASAAGDPTHLAWYSNRDTNADPREWDRNGGLVRNKSAKKDTDQAGAVVIRMHVINHRLAKWTNGDPKNVFLGTRRSNTRHEKKVEDVVKEEVRKGTKKNKDYEEALGKATEAKDDAGVQDFLFWPEGTAVSDDAVKNTQLKEAAKNKANGKVKLGKADKDTEDPGQALVVDANTPANNYLHRWVRYRVEAAYPGAYAGLPQYVKDNVDHEAGKAATLAADIAAEKDAAKKTALEDLKKQREERIEAFKGDWAKNAFASQFSAWAEYYTASYKKGQPYHKQKDGPHDYSTDL